MIKVSTWGRSEARMVDMAEAQKIVDAVYDEPMGGLALDAQTQQPITRVEPGITEIIIVEQMLGGG